METFKHGITDISEGFITENQMDIENHRTAANHLEAAALHHRDAAKHHAAGDHEKASVSTIKAYGHYHLADEAQKEDVKLHALANKR